VAFCPDHDPPDLLRTITGSLADFVLLSIGFRLFVTGIQRVDPLLFRASSIQGRTVSNSSRDSTAEAVSSQRSCIVSRMMNGTLQAAQRGTRDQSYTSLPINLRIGRVNERHWRQ
jgi:hypothetical protein